ncbi:LLM class flavin-dependent oxidoreductase [Pseudonocardia xishanensis]|uniref:LLM class flavin-dependent oxidoreductase n=1 Tax=Pseudonocardia xishanensis TaxID=630995 RepID=A0ABP8RZK4_9PSEU
MTDGRLKFGAFMAPYHFPPTNPTLALERDLQLVEAMDRLGFDEVFLGEHHSGGVEIVPAPEMFLAAAAQRTSRIRLGTGVTSIPYHHPLLVADRMLFLDHLSRGRAIFGVGPGALVGDAHMMGIDPSTQRTRLEEGFEAVWRLLNTDEPVTMETEWFTLRNGRTNLRPLQGPRLESVVAATRSPSGPRLAGRFGSGLLSLAATDPSGGFAFLEETWQIMEERAAEFGQTVDRSDWRLVTLMHVARTEKEARAQVRDRLANMLRIGATGPFAPVAEKDVEEVLRERDIDDIIDERNASGSLVIGTPAMACEQIERLVKQTGGFGSLLLMVHDIATAEDIQNSMALLAEQVVPEFTGQLTRPSEEWDKLFDARRSASTEFRNAQDKAIAEYAAERARRA